MNALMLRRTRDLTDDEVSAEHVMLRYPPGPWIGLSVLFALVLPLMLVIRRVAEPDDPDDRIWFVLMGFVFWLLIPVLLIPVRRRIIVSTGGIEVRGFRPFRLRWDEVEEIRAVEGVQGMTFIGRSGRKASVGFSLIGWRELMKRLPELCSRDAREKVMRALAIIH